MLLSKLDHTLSEAVVILLLLHGVVERTVTEVLLTVCNEELLKLKYEDEGD